MGFVIDASVIVAWLLPDEGSGYADDVAQEMTNQAAVAPAFWALEVANALVVAHRRGRIEEADRDTGLKLALELPVTSDEVAMNDTVSDAISLAQMHELAVYDAMYLELAKRKSIPLATVDAALRTAARNAGIDLMTVT